jgi:hypothetical protein
VFSFAKWCESTHVAVAIRDSAWLFPAIEIVHLAGLAVLGGTILIVDLRLLGLGLTRNSAAELFDEVQPWTVGAVAVTVLSGTLMFVSEAVDCYNSAPFRVKMLLLLVALLFTFTIRRRVARSAQRPVLRWLERLTGGTSISLWTSVAIAGRSIAYW